MLVVLMLSLVLFPGCCNKTVQPSSYFLVEAVALMLLGFVSGGGLMFYNNIIRPRTPPSLLAAAPSSGNPSHNPSELPVVCKFVGVFEFFICCFGCFDAKIIIIQKMLL